MPTFPFQTCSAVWQENDKGSLCYTTSMERSEWIANRLNLVEPFGWKIASQATEIETKTEFIKGLKENNYELVKTIADLKTEIERLKKGGIQWNADIADLLDLESLDNPPNIIVNFEDVRKRQIYNILSWDSGAKCYRDTFGNLYDTETLHDEIDYWAEIDLPEQLLKELKNEIH